MPLGKNTFAFGESHLNCRQREGTSAALHGIERARQIPKHKMSSSNDVVQVNDIDIEFAMNDAGSLHNTAEKRKKEKEEKEKIPE